MKIIKLILIFCCASFIICDFHINNKDIIAISNAIFKICDEFFIKMLINFDVIVYGETTARVLKIIGHFLGQIEGKSLINVEYVENLETWHYGLQNSAIVFFSNTTDVGKFTKSTKLTNISPKNLKFLMYFNDPKRDVPVLVNYMTDITRLLSHQYFIENNFKNIKFYTFDHFMTENCNKPTKIILNTFNKTTQKWNQKIKNHQKFATFNGCPIIVNEYFGPFMYLDKQNEEIFKCIYYRHRNCIPLISHYAYKHGIRGFTYDIFKIVSKFANFTPIFRFYSQRLSDSRQEHYEATQVPKIQVYTGSVLRVLQ